MTDFKKSLELIITNQRKIETLIFFDSRELIPATFKNFCIAKVGYSQLRHFFFPVVLLQVNQEAVRWNPPLAISVSILPTPLITSEKRKVGDWKSKFKMKILEEI